MVGDTIDNLISLNYEKKCNPSGKIKFIRESLQNLEVSCFYPSDQQNHVGLQLLIEGVETIPQQCLTSRRRICGDINQIYIDINIF